MGAMADLGVHKMDLIQYLLDDRIHTVSSRLMTLDKKDSCYGPSIYHKGNSICS